MERCHYYLFFFLIVISIWLQIDLLAAMGRQMCGRCVEITGLQFSGGPQAARTTPQYSFTSLIFTSLLVQQEIPAGSRSRWPLL